MIISCRWHFWQRNEAKTPAHRLVHALWTRIERSSALATMDSHTVAAMTNFHGIKIRPIVWTQNTCTCAMPKWMPCSTNCRPTWRIAHCTLHCSHATNVQRLSYNRAWRKSSIYRINMRTSPKWLHRNGCLTQPASNTNNTNRRANVLSSISVTSILSNWINCHQLPSNHISRIKNKRKCN